VAVLAIQAGMAGWFYGYYKSQHQEERMNNQQSSALSEAPPRPAPFAHAGYMTPRNLTALNHMLQWVGLDRDAMMRQPDRHQQLVARMQQRMQRSMRALQQMHDSMMTGDGWKNVNLAPSMDMREFDDHYEVSYSIPNITNGNTETTLQGRLLSVRVESSEPPHPDIAGKKSFQSRIMLPWNVSSNATLASSFDQGTLVVSIEKVSQAGGGMDGL
jgi:HSP20 family molecular chaperone IbpA